MKLNATPTAATIGQFPQYVHNCQRGPCEPPYAAPLPSVPRLQLYVEFGTYKPVLQEIHLQDVCNVGHTEQLFPSNYVVGQTPEGTWYGVFKYFNDVVAPVTTFVVWMSALVDTPAGLVEKTFFSEELVIEPCAPITKIKACQPEAATTTGFDVNGLYYGLPVNADYLGIPEVRYFHIAYVRQVKARELPPKGTFTASLYKNFRTQIERSWILETELVPKWYKDVLLAIYARGAIEVDGTQYLVSDLAFEALNDDDLTWKPYVNLKQIDRLYFGCDESVCAECCSPIVLGATLDFVPESPTDESPTEESPGEESPPPPSPECEIWQNTGEENATGVSYIACDGTPIGEVDITPGSNFCAQVGTLTGPAEGSLTNMGTCELELESDNFDLANDNSTICSAPTGAILWFDGPFGPGITLFTDSSATTPQTGFSRVKLGSSNLIYVLDSSTGIVLAYTGVNC